jgi:energy-coupling factor transporter ATP-binding protein EcfA2
MVTRSDVNYEQHKKDIHAIITSKYGQQKADRFIEHYASRYDRFGRSYIDWRLAYVLMDDYFYIHNKGTKWYAVVGTGGTGKSTLLKNIMYFLDEKFDRIAFDMDGWVAIISVYPKVKAYRSAMMDEPDDNYHISSEKGIILRRIFGKMRQQCLACGFCATDLKDIPPYLFRKIDGIIFTPELGKFIFFKDRPKKRSYVIQKIRSEYSKKGYSIFFEVMKTYKCLRGSTLKNSPFDLEHGEEYEANKCKDYEKDIKLFGKKASGSSGEREEERVKLIVQYKNEGLTDENIADKLGVSRARITQLKNKHGV